MLVIQAANGNCSPQNWLNQFKTLTRKCLGTPLAFLEFKRNLSAKKSLHGPISDSGFSENSELISCDLRKTLGFWFQKGFSANLSNLSCL